MSKLIINESISIPLEELLFTATRSSGPGGQHVNKTNSKVQLQWNVATTKAINEDVKNRFVRSAGSLVGKNGLLTLSSQSSRHQLANRRDCIERLRVMILDATKAPKRRKPTRPTLSSQRRKRQAKEMLARKKKLRRPPNIDS